MDVGKNTTLSNRDTTEELIELLIIAHSKKDVTRNNTSLLVITGCIASQLKHLSSKVFKDGSKINWGTGTDAGSELSLLQVTRDTTDGELKSSLGRLSLALFSISTTTTLTA